jgi:hypothetical protein
MAENQRMVKGEVSREAFWTQSYLDRWRRFGGLDFRGVGGKRLYPRGHRGNVRFDKGRCRVENLSLSFR